MPPEAPSYDFTANMNVTHFNWPTTYSQMILWQTNEIKRNNQSCRESFMRRLYGQKHITEHLAVKTVCQLVVDRLQTVAYPGCKCPA